MKCQEEKCNGVMENKIIHNYHTKMGGIPIVVKYAKILKCPICGSQIYSAKEVKKWERIAKLKKENG